MNHYVTDTHPLVWAMSDDARLSATAKSAFDETDAGQAIITIPPIVIVEMIYLSEKGRINNDLIDDLLAEISVPGVSYQLGEFDTSVITSLRQIPRSTVPEMPDRIIAATAMAMNCSLITRDAAIISSGVVPIIW
ncbi:MAG: PIN domain-containing protein [Acidobacteriota bacterium]